jgi:carbon monoxide dehydrogenase subunit G
VKLADRERLPAPPEEVWRLLNDPARLAKCLPGCEELVPAGPDRYTAKIRLALAAISGNFTGSVELMEKEPPHALRMRLEGKGIPGFVRAEGQIELADANGETEIRYDGEAQIGGMIAAVGQRMLETATRKLIRQFFENAAALLRSGRSL